MNKTKFNLGLTRFLYWISTASVSFIAVVSIYSILFLDFNPIDLEIGYQLIKTLIVLYLFNDYIKYLKGALDEQRRNYRTPRKSNK